MIRELQVAAHHSAMGSGRLNETAATVQHAAMAELLVSQVGATADVIHATAQRLSHAKPSERRSERQTLHLAWLMSLVRRVMNVANCVRRGQFFESDHYVTHEPVGVPAALADLAVELFAMSEAMGVDLERAINRKLVHEEKRARRKAARALRKAKKRAMK